MVTTKTCPICELGESVCTEVARQFAVGLPASDVTAYLGTLGHRRTQRQLTDHRRHVVSPISPRVAVATATHSNLEVCQTVNEPPPTLPSSEIGLSDLDREERLILSFLAATDRMLAALEQTGSIKVSRAATELGALAHNMLRERMSRAVLPDPVINIIMSRKRLEDCLPTNDTTEELP